MKLRDRLSLAFSILRPQPKSKLVRITEDEIKALATQVSPWVEGHPQYSETNFENLVKQGYRKNELIFACIAKTAATSAQVELKVYSKRSGEELSDHPLKALIQRPNRYMSEFDFWAAVVVYQKLGGRAVFELERNNRGDVINLWPLRPDWIEPIPSKKELISAYSYNPPGVEAAILKREDILDFRLFDPLNFFHSWPPVAVAARVGDIDNASTDHVKRIFDKGAIPPFLLTTNVKLTDVEIEEIINRWIARYGGADRWVAPGVLDVDAKVQKLGFDFQELGFEVLDERDEARICMVLDVPPIVVGARIGLNRSTITNYREARQSWWEDTLIPMYENHKDVMQNQLIPEFGDDIYVEWDYTGVYALQEENTVKWTRGLEALRAGAITINEFRMQVGLPNLGPAGEIRYSPMAITEFPTTTPGSKSIDLKSLVPTEAKEIELLSGPPDEGTRKYREEQLQRGLEELFATRQNRVMKIMSDLEDTFDRGIDKS